VAFADWLRGFGLLLIVDHGDGFMTLYGHNQSLFKEVGDWVDSNEPIALVGSSGGREQAGVYFGIRHEGRPVNPAQWCRRPDGRRVG
jgi:septal ring factor EnvC (AmiA/AmiB activator)